MLQGALDESDGFLDVVAGHGLGEAHLGVGFGETDHGFQLTGRGCDAALRGADVFAKFAHLDVGVDELLGGFGANAWLAGGAGVGDVGCEKFDGLGLLAEFWWTEKNVDLPEFPFRWMRFVACRPDTCSINA